MWTLNWSPCHQNVIDEFESDNQRKNPRMNNAIGLFLPSGLCIIGLYWFYIPKEDYVNQYLVVIWNNAFGIWYDENAELYNTRQWRTWNWIKRVVSSD